MKATAAVFFLLSRAVGAEAQVGTLENYITTALTNSPLLYELRNTRISVSLDSVRQRKTFGPVVSGGVNASYAPTFGKFGYDGAISNGGATTATFAFNQTFGGPLLSAGLFNIRVRTDSIENVKAVSVVDLKNGVTARYVQAYIGQQQLFFQREILTILYDEEAPLKKLVRGGQYKQSDYLTFLVSRQAQEVAVSQALLASQNDLAQLNVLCGINDTLFTRLNDPALTRKPPSIFESPQYLKYQVDSLRLIGEEKLLTASYKPRFNVQADVGVQSSVSTFYKYPGASVGFGLAVPIYDGHLRNLGLKKIKLAEQSRRFSRLNFLKQSKQVLEATTQQLTTTSRLESKISEQVRYAQLLIEANKRLLNAGELKVTEYLLSLNNYRLAQFSLTQQALARYLLINQLNYWPGTR